MNPILHNSMYAGIVLSTLSDIWEKNIIKLIPFAMQSVKGKIL